MTYALQTASVLMAVLVGRGGQIFAHRVFVILQGTLLSALGFATEDMPSDDI